jgi:ribonuclease D
MTKEEINDLPLRRYEGPIHLVTDASELAQALREIRKEPVLGFDTETRAAFRKGQSYLPSLMQIGTTDAVYLIQISATGITKPLTTILADPERLKVGVGLDHEIVTLRKMADFEPAGFVELGPIADKVGVEANGLRNLAACVLGIRISKQAKTSNWAKPQLTEEQIFYAATDAWVSREIHVRLMQALNGNAA